MKLKGLLCIALFLALITASAVSATPSENHKLSVHDHVKFTKRKGGM
jgi:hypothetical protein